MLTRIVIGVLFLGCCFSVMATQSTDVQSLVDHIRARQKKGDIHAFIQTLETAGILKTARQAVPVAAPALGTSSPKTETGAHAERHLLVFVSFSLPEATLINTLAEAKRLGATAVLRGLKGGSLKKTLQAAYRLSQKTGAGLAIDPVAFERFNIEQVPAWVVFNENHSGVVLGAVSADYALSVIAQHAEKDVRTLAQTALKQYRQEEEF